MKPADAKLQRWIDLIAALSSLRYGATFDELKSIIPAYGGDQSATTLERMFERDKDELRALGIPVGVRTNKTEAGEEQRYYIKPAEMYLPYLKLAASVPTRSKVPPPGYRTLPTLTFEPDELSALIQSAQKVRSLNVDELSKHATNAIQKLTYDLGAALGSAVGESPDHAVQFPDRNSAPTVTTLGDALLRRKTVRFDYRSMNRDATETREAEPYGLFFSSGHWYLAARDIKADATRTFRVSRIEKLKPNTKRPQSVDYEIPKSFRLTDHAATKGPWELGDDAAEEMIVEIRGATGASLAAKSLGRPVEGKPSQRCFQVRRIDSFVRWIMSFAGEVVPVSPPRLVDQHREVLRRTLALYQTPNAEPIA